MIMVLLGDSGSGKSFIEKEFSTRYGFEKIIPYTTRKQRHGEINGKDYYFISNETFDEMLNLGLFAEYEEYSQGRKYGTLKIDYNASRKTKIVILTPNGLRQIKKIFKLEDIFSIYIQSNLGTRIKRYIDRIGSENFTFDDKNEIFSRVERDYTMFLGIKNEVDITINNDEGTSINDIINDILNV